MSFDTLAGLTVAEVGSSPAAGMLGLVLSWLGGDVSLILPDGGHPLQSAGTPPGALFTYLHGSKTHVGSGGAPAEPDVVVWSPSADAPAFGEVLATYPDALIAAVTPYGLTGPRSGESATELTLEAAAGLLSVTPRYADGATREPLKLPGQMGRLFAGLTGAATVLAAVTAGVRATVLDLAEVEAMVPAFAPLLGGFDMMPLEVTHASPAIGWHLVPCRDGHVMIAHGLPVPWEQLQVAMGSPDWATSDDYADMMKRSLNGAAFRAEMQPWLDRYTRAELFDIFAAHGGASAPVLGIADPLVAGHLAARGSLGEALTADGTIFTLPTAPFAVTGR